MIKALLSLAIIIIIKEEGYLEIRIIVLVQIIILHYLEIIIIIKVGDYLETIIIIMEEEAYLVTIIPEEEVYLVITKIIIPIKVQEQVYLAIVIQLHYLVIIQQQIIQIIHLELQILILIWDYLVKNLAELVQQEHLYLVIQISIHKRRLQPYFVIILLNKLIIII
jgi:hypothetical protein